MRQESEVHFLFGTVILGLLSIFKKSQASSPYEALNSMCLSRVQRDMRAPLQKRLGPRAFSRDCTEYSDIPLFFEMKDEPAFKPLQGNPSLFRARESRYPLHLRQQIQCPSHVPIAEGRLLFRFLWEGGTPLQSKTENQLSSWDDMVCMALSSSCCTEINIHIDLRLMSQVISVVS